MGCWVHEAHVTAGGAGVGGLGSDERMAEKGSGTRSVRVTASTERSVAVTLTYYRNSDG